MLYPKLIAWVHVSERLPESVQVVPRLLTHGNQRVPIQSLRLTLVPVRGAVTIEVRVGGVVHLVLVGVSVEITVPVLIVVVVVVSVGSG